MTTGYVSQIFSTLQGEGPFVGERQIFIRLAGCPWRCRYCDTPESLSAEGKPLMSADDVLDAARRLNTERPHPTVSITGGEPLMQADFLATLLPGLRAMGLKVYLETSGTHPALLRRVADLCDVVAMDFKLPSAIGRSLWAEHEEFLTIAGPKAFVKVVLTADSTAEEFEQAVNLLASRDPAPTLVLQPVTPIAALDERLGNRAPNGHPKLTPPSPHHLLDWLEMSRQRLPDVRLIPQMHPLWGLP